MTQVETYRRNPKSVLNAGQTAYARFQEKGVSATTRRASLQISFDDPTPRKSTKQLEREITGDTPRFIGSLASWRKSEVQPGRRAVKQPPNFFIATSRPMRIASAAGATSINFRVTSISKTSKRRVVSESWHSADHAKYIERTDAVADVGLNDIAAMASGYIERERAVAFGVDETKAIHSNISTDAGERERFWQLVEAHESEGGENLLTIDMSEAGSLARAVSADPECPEELRAAIKKAKDSDIIRFESGDHDALRVVFEGHGWRPPPKGKRRLKGRKASADLESSPGATPGVKFADSRAGRTQIQANGELPAEVSLAAKGRIAKGIRDWFDDRSLPVTVVVHKPDHKNRKSNWHFHFAAYDRPCRRFNNSAGCLHELKPSATKAEMKSHEEASALVGNPALSAYKENPEWDFAVPWVKQTKSRNKRVTFPFRQNKDRYCNGEKFIEDLRKLVVDLCNHELKREGHRRRYDHRTYELMGINKDADEHLDKAAAQLEKFGIPTAKGTANEQRQWAYIIGELDQHHAEGVKAIEEVHRKLIRPVEGRDTAAEGTLFRSADQWRLLAISASEGLRAEQELDQLLLRAKSRANVTAEACQEHLTAIDDGTANKAEVQDRHLYQERLRLAGEHLALIDFEFEWMVQERAQLKRQRLVSLAAAKKVYEQIKGVRPGGGNAEADLPETVASDRQQSISLNAAGKDPSASPSTSVTREVAIERLVGYARKFPERIKILRDSGKDDRLTLDRAPPALAELARAHGADPALLHRIKSSNASQHATDRASISESKEKASRQQTTPGWASPEDLLSR